MKWMPIRQFLRGGYQEIKEPTVVTSHGHPVFTVMPAAGQIPGPEKLPEPPSGPTSDEQPDPYLWESGT